MSRVLSLPLVCLMLIVYNLSGLILVGRRCRQRRLNHLILLSNNCHRSPRNEDSATISLMLIVMLFLFRVTDISMGPSNFGPPLAT